MNEDERLLVLARLRTLRPEGKLSLGGSKEVTVKELIAHVEKGDDFGRKIVQAQMGMLRVLGKG